MRFPSAFPVTHTSDAAEPRRAILRAAAGMGFSEERAGRAALIVSELATNLAKHARAGELLLGRLPSSDGSGEEGLEAIAIDRGPGIPDVALSRKDGYSTSGTLGHGLGAIERQADAFHVYTQPSGTVAVARIWRDSPGKAAVRAGPRLQIGAISVAVTGEDVCGDAYAWRIRAERLAVIVADGLGHGMHAHDAAVQAVRIFADQHESPPARVIGGVHLALRSTRGAAVAMLAVNLEQGTAAYAGLGNISAVIQRPGGGRASLVSHNGTAGHSAGRIQEFSYPAPPGSMTVLHTDGLSTRWDLTAYPGVTTLDPSVTAALLYRDFSRRRDDVTVLVIRDRQPSEHFFSHKL